MYLNNNVTNKGEKETGEPTHVGDEVPVNVRMTTATFDEISLV